MGYASLGDHHSTEKYDPSKIQRDPGMEGMVVNVDYTWICPRGLTFLYKYSLNT